MLFYFNNILSVLTFLPLLTYFHYPAPSQRISSQCSEDMPFCLLTELGLFFHLRIPSSTIKMEWKDCTLILNTKLLLSFKNCCLPYFFRYTYDRFLNIFFSFFSFLYDWRRWWALLYTSCLQNPSYLMVKIGLFIVLKKLIASATFKRAVMIILV